MSRKWGNSFKVTLLIGQSLLLVFFLASCGGGSDGGVTSGGITGGGGGGESKATVSGKVTLSSAVAEKVNFERFKAMLDAPKGKPGSERYKAARKTAASLRKTLNAASYAVAFLEGRVFLYNSDHPEWLCPVAEDATDSLGNYTISTLVNATCNGNVYTDGDPLPAGNYTILAYKEGGFDPILGITTDALVAIQTVVNSFSGTITGADLLAQESDSVPTVETIAGVFKNTDGTQTWGNADLELPANAAIQVTFSMAISRGTLSAGAISIAPAIADGYWAVSPDWLSATYYLGAETLTVGETYTITVNGADCVGCAAKITNVYTNALAKTATGTFTVVDGGGPGGADIQKPTAIFVSPTVFEMAEPQDVIIPIRIGSNEVLDINNLLLTAVPSLGAKPGVLYIGRNNAGLYVYEFVLGDPLSIGQYYDLTASGGKDLAGNELNPVYASLTIKGAADIAGVDATADPVTQDAQASVKNAFGKWKRALNDRNLAQVQGLMSADFVFEYDVAEGVWSEDRNRDGRVSMAEFGAMLENTFLQWENCQTTMSGDVVGNINIAGSSADFEFTLNETSLVTSSECSGGGPDESSYATLNNVNGAWTIVRLSDGLDTRTIPLAQSAVITLTTPGDGFTLNTSVAGGSLIDGTIPPDNANPINFTWDNHTGVTVSSYVLVLINARDSHKGVAVAVPSLEKSFIAPPPSGGNYENVSQLFGFHSENMGFEMEGAEFYWEVIGLGNTTVSNISNIQSSALFDDIVAISDLNWYKNPGEYKELALTVSTGGAPLTFSEYIWGYDAGNSGTVTIKIDSPDIKVTTARVSVSGHSWKDYSVPLACYTTACTGSVTVDLFQGNNHISVNDGNKLQKDFNVMTTGGTPPVVELTAIFDNVSATALVGDNWNYYKANSGASSVTVEGTVSVNVITELWVNVWNDDLRAYNNTPVIPDCTGFITNGLCTFSVILPIYGGDNWINFGSDYFDPVSNQNVWTSNHIGIYTDTGAVWVPPFAIDVSDLTGVLSPTCTGCSDYSTADSQVTVSGTYTGDDQRISLSVSGTVWKEFWVCESGLMNPYDSTKACDGTLALDGTFTLTLDLYNGWNYFNLNDESYNNYDWFNVETSGGQPRPLEVTSVVNVGGTVITETYTDNFETDADQVTISGTYLNGDQRLRISVNGKTWKDYWVCEIDLMHPYDSAKACDGLLTVNADQTKSFSLTVDIYNGNNNINVNDESWTNSAWVNVDTTGGTPLPLEVTAVTNVGGTYITQTYDTDYDTDADQVTVSGIYRGTDQRVRLSVNGKISKEYWLCDAGLTDPWGNTCAGLLNADGTFSHSVDIYSGSNSISLNDESSMSSTWLYVNTSGGIPLTLDVTSVVNVGGTYFVETYDDNYDTDADKVSIVGSYAGADQRLKVSVSGMMWKEYWVCEAGLNDPSGNVCAANTLNAGTFSLTVDIYNGWNGIYLNDETNSNSYYLYVDTTGGTPLPLEITSVVNVDGTSMLETSSNGFETDASSITLSGHYTGADTTLYLNLNNGDSSINKSYTLCATGCDGILSAGTFSITIDIYGGWNYFNIHDESYTNSNWVDVSTSGGAVIVRDVEITSPVHDSTVSGAVTVTGTIDDPAFTSVVRGYVNDDVAMTSSTYTSDPAEATAMGWGTLTITAASDGFSFDATIAVDNPTNIYVYAYDALGNLHYHSIYVNNVDMWGQNYGKPSIKSETSGADDGAKDRLKRNHIFNSVNKEATSR